MGTQDDMNLRAPFLEQHDPKRGGCLGWPCMCFNIMLSSMKNIVLPFFLTLWQVIWKEPAKTIHAFKMGLALTLAFLLVLLKAPYNFFGSHAIWAIMTLIVVFEFSIGATLSKGLNRGAGTLLAGILAVIIGQLAKMTGGLAHPIMVGLSGVVTFAKLWPTLRSYEFGFRTFLLTFSLIMVAEYRQEDPLGTAIDRFFVILVGASIGLSVNLFVLPLWAGEELHEGISKNFACVADSLEVCVNEYLKGTLLERVPSKIFMGLAADDPVYKSYRSALMSGAKEETLAGFAIWEPPHGRFKGFKYPWHNYVKVGAILRHCTYSIVALHGCLRSAIQAPLDVRLLFEKELRDVSVEGAKVLRTLGKHVQNMEKADYMGILDGVRRAVDRLQQSLYLNSYLLVRQEVGFTDNYVDNFAVSVIPELKKHGHGDHHHHRSSGFFRTGSSHKMGFAKSRDDLNEADRNGIKKLHSWPSRPIDDLDFTKDSIFEQRVRVLESASALSLGTFATLLMEVALRLDYVVEAVEELGNLANFKHPQPQAVSLLNGSV
ncbi:hypothetical protein KP509_25G051800 [Ceratopteris richardii]|uniref:Aluminum-activated malate transporter n=1 Tax=Ceratopteris richardii TaxID=49495 RepID=A0A8T2RQA3_CERRI|nr:hypothetical protein KP509_25G051800 [Ceratopteris richardii]